MQAVILAGGRGQRLRPMTDYVPKPLAPLANVPLLEWQLRYLDKFGICDVVVCSGYKTQMMEEYLEQTGRRQVIVSAEDRPLGTAGAIKNASKFIQDQFFVLNGDIITDINLHKIPPWHMAAVLMRTQFGVLHIRNDEIVGFGEKTQLPDVWINAGIYHFGIDMLDELPEYGDMEKTVFAEWTAQKRLRAVRFPDARWYSIDSFKDMTECSGHVKDIIG